MRSDAIHREVVTAIVVSYNTCAALARCLASLRAASAEADLRVQVVDNASRDGSAEMVRRDFPEIRLRARMVMDIIAIDLAANYFDGLFATVHGRTYPGTFVDGLNDSTREAAWLGLRQKRRCLRRLLVPEPRYVGRGQRDRVDCRGRRERVRRRAG